MKTAIVIPTIKTIPDCILKLGADIIIVRDKGRPQQSDEFDTIPKRKLWLDKHIGFAPDFLLRKQGDSARNFGLLVAYQRGYDRVISMDDDVEVKDGFLASHKIGAQDNLRVTGAVKFLDVMDYMESNVRQRGYPFEFRDEHSSAGHSKIKGNVKMNIGLWSGIPDCGAIDKIPGIDWKCKCDLKEQIAIPKGTDAATCTMNLAMSRDVIPAFYQPDMCVDIVPGMQLDRFADMWSGYILKKLIDIKGDIMTFGAPVVEHLKEGDINRELVGEYVGNMMYRDFRNIVDLITNGITSDSYTNMYKQFVYDFGYAITNATAKTPEPYLKYFQELARNMLVWIKCIEKIDEGIENGKT